MAIKTIEIICLPCNKCDGLEWKIRDMIKNIEAVHRVKIIYELKLTRNLHDLTEYSLNPSQTPVVLINGNVEFAGKVDLISLRRRLEAEHMRG